MFDVLIIGGGVAGMSCAMILGSAKEKNFVACKKIGIIAHQKTSALQDGIYNNAYGIPAGKLGADLLTESKIQLQNSFPDVVQIENEKVIKIEGICPNFIIATNKNSYQSQLIVFAIGYSHTFNIDGMMGFVENHKKALPEKKRIQLKNVDHKVAEGIFVAGTLAGWRSQLSIAAGSGAAVATDILTIWNNGIQTQIHDKIDPKKVLNR